MENRQDFIEINRNFFDTVSNYYDFFFENFTINMQERVVSIVKIHENARILDAGCGTGNLLALLEKSGKALELYGIDISPKMLNIARKKVRKANLVMESADNLPFKNNFFDNIFTMDAFHHFYNPHKTMAEFNKCLKSNGLLVIVDFYFGQCLSRIFHNIEPGNKKFYSPSEMSELFKSSGFKNIKQEKVGFFTFMTHGRKN